MRKMAKENGLCGDDFYLYIYTVQEDGCIRYKHNRRMENKAASTRDREKEREKQKLNMKVYKYKRLRAFAQKKRKRGARAARFVEFLL